MLRYFDTVGISLDSRLRIIARRDFAGMISVTVQNPGTADPGADQDAQATVELGSPAAQAIWVVPWED